MISKKRILVVEDNELNRELLKEILSVQYEVLEAENGRGALEILKHWEHQIELILLDIQMPVMDGFAFLEQLRKDDGLALIPVIVTTQS
ncbi:MAG: response regulator, partial [Clostridium sp.]|nr:response regulator [Clostridium sp.]